MMIKKLSNIIAIVIWILASGLWTVSMIISNLEITNETIRNICLILTISGLLYGLVYILPIKKPKNLGGIITVASVLILGLIIKITDWTGDWKTQTILYEHGHLKNKTIEFQMQDKGALGFNRRIVEVTRITGFINYVEPIDTSKVTLPWLKVNKDINEIGFKGG